MPTLHVLKSLKSIAAESQENGKTPGEKPRESLTSATPCAVESGSRGTGDAALVPRSYEKVGELHQYYRDCLSQSYEFPSIGKFTLDFIRWAANSTDSIRLAELLATVRDSGLETNHDAALRLMLFTIQHANLALDRNNKAADWTLPPAVADAIRQGLQRVQSLHRHPSYVVDAAQLLYRIKATDDIIALSKMHTSVFQNSLPLQAIMGFVHTIAGDYAEAMRYLQPLTVHPTGCNLPLVALSAMTCRYFLGETPTSPVTFDSLDTSTDGLALQIGRLAPLEMIQPLERPMSCPVVFAACNDRYFYQHALHLAASIHATNPGKLALHLHLYSPNQGVLADIDRLRERMPGLMIGVSAERGACPITHAPSYYAVARFVRAYELLTYYRSEFCMIDADAMFNRPWEEFIGQFDPKAELALACPTSSPFWEQVIAGLIYCKYAPIAEHFLAKVAQFILRNIERKTAVWFTDQIALSVCNDRFTKRHPAVSHVPCDRLIDIQHHHPLSPIWAVTTRKSGVNAYDAMRERLGRQYGFLPSGDRDYLLSHVSRVKAPVFFLQIGAMDGASYDPIHAHVKAHGWHGLLVEPLPDMMDRLRATYTHQKGLVFENVAITEQEETRIMFRIPVEAIKTAGLPDCLKGMSTFVPGKLDEYKPHVVEQPVSCMPLARLLAKHRPVKIDVLQVDAEGYDFKILKQFDFSRYQPCIINFEYVNLGPQEKIDIETLLLSNGYLFYQDDMDVFAVRRDMFFT